MHTHACYNINRKKKKHGGIGTCVKGNERLHTLKVNEGSDDLEMLITRHSQFATPVNVINIYGKVETRSSNEEIEERWTAILKEVKKVEAKKEVLVIIGDLNSHVGTLIKGNHEKVSHGGRLLREFLDSGSYVLVNATNKVTNGPFTRVDPSDTSKKAALDLCIISKELLKYVDSLVIDNGRGFTPFRSIDKKNVKYTDHYSLLVSFKNIPLLKNKVASQGIVRWNTNREGGWSKYKEMTNNNDIFNEIAVMPSGDPEKMMNDLDKELKRVKFESFGRVKFKSRCLADKELAGLQSQKLALVSDHSDEIEEEKLIEIEGCIASKLQEKQQVNFQKEISDLLDVKTKKGNAAALFKLKEKVVGAKNLETEAVTIVDPASGLEVTSAKELRHVTLTYCHGVLTNRQPTADYEDDLKMKVAVHMTRLSLRYL